MSEGVYRGDNINSPPQTPSELDKAVEELSSFGKDEIVTQDMIDVCKSLDVVILAAKRLKEVERANDYCCKLLKDYGLDEAAPLEKLVRSIINRVKEVEMELKQEKIWKVEDPRMLREQCRVSDVAFQSLHERFCEQSKQLSTLRTEYKNALEALDNGLSSLRHIVTALHANNAISPDARIAINQMKEVLSTPHAIAAMKKGEV